MRVFRTLAAFVFAAAIVGGTAGAQTPAKDPSERLREVLPADVAERVLAKIAAARARQLPAQALENRALKFAASGVAPRNIERAIGRQVENMERAKAAIEGGRGRRASASEIEAGGEAVRKGVDGAAVSDLAKSAPSGRSLAVPLFVIGSLIDRGLPSDEALRRVHERLQARATDAELRQLPEQVVANREAARQRRPAETGREAGVARRPATPSGGRPAAVPANPGAGARGTSRRPANPGRP